MIKKSNIASQSTKRKELMAWLYGLPFISIFYQVDEGLLEAYVQSGSPMDKAGAYGIQDMGALLVAGIQGDYYTVMGLPVARLYRELKAWDQA